MNKAILTALVMTAALVSVPALAAECGTDPDKIELCSSGSDGGIRANQDEDKEITGYDANTRADEEKEREQDKEDEPADTPVQSGPWN